MSSKDRNLIIIGVIICLFIAVLSPFIASNNPDGLEKSAADLAPDTEPESAIGSPSPDYKLEQFGKFGEIVALVLGILITLIVAYFVAIILKRRKPSEKP